MRLLLFDIDGTLLRVHRGGRAAVRKAVGRVTGKSISTEAVSFSGRTDPAIFREVLTVNGVSADDELIAAVIDTYSAVAQELIRSENVQSLPGVEALLSALAARNDVFLGLLTGNVEAVAVHKLEMAGLHHHFALGAYGSDHEDRSQLPALATRRAAQAAGRSFACEEILVIGDTQHDVACARAGNVRSVAVSTGHPSHADLAASSPDLLLEDLNNTAQTVEHMLSL
jgi:phosphoglycolate phosphatase-like HAD superfamily hydrolase